MPKYILAPLLGVHPTTFGQALRPVTRALAVIPQPPAAPPPGARPRTRDELLGYAAAHGIDLTVRQTRKADTAPEATLADPDTRQTHLILEHLHIGQVLHVAVTIAGVEDGETVTLVERPGIGVLLKDVQGHPVRTVPPDLIKQ